MFCLSCNRQRQEHFRMLPETTPKQSFTYVTLHWFFSGKSPSLNQVAVPRQSAPAAALTTQAPGTTPQFCRCSPSEIQVTLHLCLTGDALVCRGGGEEGPVGKETAASFLSQGKPGRRRWAEQRGSQKLLWLLVGKDFHWGTTGYFTAYQSLRDFYLPGGPGPAWGPQ